MSEKVLDIADELTQQLVALLDLPAKRIYRLLTERAKLKDTRLCVFPFSGTLEPIDREGNEEIHEIAIAMQAPLESLDDVEAINGLVNQMGSIKALYREGGELRDAELAGCPWATLQHAPLWDPKRMLEDKEFLSIIRVGYREL